MSEPNPKREAIYRSAILVVTVIVGLGALADLLYPEIPPDNVVLHDLGARPVMVLYLEQGVCPRQEPKCWYVTTSPLSARIEGNWIRTSSGPSNPWLDSVRDIVYPPKPPELRIKEGDPLLTTSSSKSNAVAERKLYDILREHPGRRPQLYALLDHDRMLEWQQKDREWYDVASSIVRFAITIAILLAAVAMVWYAPQTRTFVLAMGLTLFAISAFPLDFVWVTYIGAMPQRWQIEIAEWLQRVFHPALVYASNFLIGLFLLLFPDRTSRSATLTGVLGFVMACALAATNIYIYHKDLYTPTLHCYFIPFVIIAIAATLSWLTVCYFVSRWTMGRTGDVGGLTGAFVCIVLGIAAESGYYAWFFTKGSYERTNSLWMAVLGLCYLVLPIGTCWVLSKRGLIRIVSPSIVVVLGTATIAVIEKLAEKHVSGPLEGQTGLAPLLALVVLLVALPQAQSWLTDAIRSKLKDPTSPQQLSGLRKRLESARSIEAFGVEALTYMNRFTNGKTALLLYLEGDENPKTVAGYDFFVNANADVNRQLRIAADGSYGSVLDFDGASHAIAVPLRDSTRTFGFILYVPGATDWLSDPSEPLPQSVVDTIANAVLKCAYLDSAQTFKDWVLCDGYKGEFAGFARISSVGIRFRPPP